MSLAIVHAPEQTIVVDPVKLRNITGFLLHKCARLNQIGGYSTVGLNLNLTTGTNSLRDDSHQLLSFTLMSYKGDRPKKRRVSVNRLTRDVKAEVRKILADSNEMHAQYRQAAAINPERMGNRFYPPERPPGAQYRSMTCNAEQVNETECDALKVALPTDHNVTLFASTELNQTQGLEPLIAC
ncbi:MAG: hypothetical protein M1838_000138 [Thelocarpon superellum]|nr:MAG: hypothetical protein M1838_000138 [Thelocarpon superellum]